VLLGTPLRNTLGTHWEREENMFLSKEKLKKPSPPHPHPKLPSVHASAYPSAACVFDSKTVGHHFWPGLTAGAEFRGHSMEEDAMTKLEESQIFNLTICYHVAYYGRVLRVRVRGINSRHLNKLVLYCMTW
jgi:hypothetical protein